MQELPELNRRRLIFGMVFIAVSLGALYFLLPRLAGFHETWGQLADGEWWLLVLAAIAEVLSIAGYAVLYHTVFARGVPRVTWSVTVQITLAGIAAIRLLAAAGVGGVVITAWALRRAGLGGSLIAQRLVALYVIQYAIYLGALVIFGLGLWFGLFPGGGSFSLTIVPAIFGALAIVLVLAMSFIPQDFERLAHLAHRRSVIGRWAARLAKAPESVGSGVREAIALVRERRVGLLGAIAYWAFDIACLGLSFKAFNEDVPIAVLVMGYFVGTLGSLLPLPGGIGGIEGGMIGAFAAFGIPAERAVVSVLAYRAISFWLPTIPGIVGFFKLRSTVRAWQQADREPASAGPGLGATLALRPDAQER
jgi:uncharacterized protein (TIRG00374 family)